MKKMFAIICAIALLLTACGGNIRNVQKIFGQTEQYAKEDIESAMDVALDYFAFEFEGCTMITIQYDPVKDDAANAWAQQYGADQAIILLSSFEVGASGGDGSLNPNSTYSNWQWILTRNEGEKWTLRTWGYG